MRRLPLVRARAALLLVVTLGGAAACVDQKPPGVAIKSFKSDIIFGLNPPAAAPPAITPSVGFDLPAQAPLPPLRPPRVRVPEACPAARRGESVQELATTGVDKRPVPGVYKWKVRGTLDYDGVQVPIVIPTIDREIFDVSEVVETTTPIGGNPATQPIITKTFTYKMRVPLGQRGELGSQVVFFQVKDDPVTLDVGPSVANIGKSVTVGDPERGVTLKRIENYDPTGRVISVFAPVPGILLLPLSVNGGENYQSVGVDPATGAVLVHDGTVDQRKTVDACGTLIDGWRVTSREYFINPLGGASVAQYDYIIATQLGGILVFEHTHPPDLANIPIPTPPVLPGNPLPNLPPIPTSLPPLPVELPTTKNNVEFSIATMNPAPPK